MAVQTHTAEVIQIKDRVCQNLLSMIYPKPHLIRDPGTTADVWSDRDLRGVAEKDPKIYKPCGAEMFEHAIRLAPQWEKTHFSYARYLDQRYRDAKERQASKVR